jgi:uncharacterized protein YndB with AHSA1/START domain
MTSQKSLKRRVRERMSKTGERYAAARGQVVAKRDRIQAATTRLSVDTDRPADERVAKATGRLFEEWFSILDDWGAPARTYRMMAEFLIAEHQVDGWWAQSITYWYQRSRGLRLKHQQPDGFTIYASKTIAASADVVFAAFVDDDQRSAWLTDGTMSLRTAEPARTARFDWQDGQTRVSASFDERGPSKTTIAVAHERLPDADEAERAKSAWRQRLGQLQRVVEVLPDQLRPEA